MEFWQQVIPGDKALVYDPWAGGRKPYWNNNGAWQNATIVKRYGKRQYPDLVDVVFDITGRISRGHFTDGILEPIPV